ncbi:hypothetical protein C4D60_Mb10t28570 [Musa balbisiana]|uniref:Rubisco LSMT substrate-binding domain-containing protein n=1 Tax=Musa balbisiana TaxID=52838 RepID=A0A4S8J2Y1_MUSBA|nr:hypothetical protein C4D60_Mb10t28570 [Musa balbisiana]
MPGIWSLEVYGPIASYPSCSRQTARFVSSPLLKMVTVAASKMLTAVSTSAASLAHRRPLTCRATASAATASRLVPHPSDLIGWVRREGGFVHPNLRIADGDPYGLGVVATNEIPPGSELIALPSHLLLRFDRSPESDGGCDGPHSTLVELARRVPDELWAMRLGLKLLQERATTHSFWWPYISNLPETFSIPIFFSGDDIKNLHYAPLIHQVVADTQIKQDTHVLLNYGSLSNDFFLLDYGFVIPSNPHDHVELKYDEALLDAASLAAGVSSSSFLSPSDWQQDILSRLNLRGDEALLKVTLGGPGLVDGRLLAALRVLISSNKETVQRHDLDTLMSLSEVAPLGMSTEVAALRTVIALCVVALESFPTKIMQDESILKTAISYSTELAVRFRMQKKLTIIDVMRNLTQKVKKISKMELTAQN